MYLVTISNNLQQKKDCGILAPQNSKTHIASQILSREFAIYAAQQGFPKAQHIKITKFDPELSTVFSIFRTHLGPIGSASAHRKWGLEGLECRIDDQKKFIFGRFFCLLLFGNLLKYLHVCQKANANRQQAKMTFQFACRKPPSGKVLEPATYPCML